MKKHLIVSGIVFVLLIVVLSGCVEGTKYDNSKYPSDEIEVINYKIETYNRGTPDIKIGDGFLHSENDSYYKVSGEIKNIGDELLKDVITYVNFYDIDNNLLDWKDDYTWDLANSYTEKFSVYYFSSEIYFEEVWSIEFETKAYS